MFAMGVRNRPITATMLFATSAYALWQSAILFLAIPRLPTCASSVIFQGPFRLMTGAQWSQLFLVSGLITLSRLWLLDKSRMVDWVLHVIGTLPILVWSCSFLVLAPASTSQPTFALIACVVIALPYVTSVIERSWGARLLRLAAKLDRIPSTGTNKRGPDRKADTPLVPAH